MDIVLIMFVDNIGRWKLSTIIPIVNLWREKREKLSETCEMLSIFSARILNLFFIDPSSLVLYFQGVFRFFTLDVL